MIAGANAALKVLGKPAFHLTRADAYIGVMIDDLVTKGTPEPYRMFTSRAEHRLLLRQDNADLRLTPLAHAAGLIDSERWTRTCEKLQQMENVRAFVETTRLEGMKLSQWLKRPENTVHNMAAELTKAFPEQIWDAVETEIKYAGYITRQESAVDRLRTTEERKIPVDVNYATVHGLRAETRQKLEKVRPETMGQAARISGITPADLALLSIWLEAPASGVTTVAADNSMPSRRWTAALGIALLAVLVVLFFRTMDRDLNHDEHQFLAPGALLSREGLLPYRDYPLFHLPNLVFLYAAGDWLTGSPIFSAKLFSFASSAGMLCLLAWIASGTRSLRPRMAAIAGFSVALLLFFDPVFYYTAGKTWNHRGPLVPDSAGDRTSGGCAAAFVEVDGYMERAGSGSRRGDAPYLCAHSAAALRRPSSDDRTLAPANRVEPVHGVGRGGWAASLTGALPPGTGELPFRELRIPPLATARSG